MVKIQVNSQGKAYITNSNKVLLANEGITPSGTININENGNYDVTSYASAAVTVSGGSATRFGLSLDNFIGEIVNGVLKKPDFFPQTITFTGVTNIADHALENLFAYKGSSLNVSNIIFPDLVEVSGHYALSYFCYNSDISLSFPNLTTISGIESLSYLLGSGNISIPNLTTISESTGFGYALSRYTGNSFTFEKLSTISGKYALGGCFEYNGYIQTINFPALTSNSFGNRNSQFKNMLKGVIGCTVHFPSTIQSTIENWSDVQNGFGGTNTVVLYDLPATE